VPTRSTLTVVVVSSEYDRQPSPLCKRPRSSRQSAWLD